MRSLGRFSRTALVNHKQTPGPNLLRRSRTHPIRLRPHPSVTRRSILRTSTRHTTTRSSSWKNETCSFEKTKPPKTRTSSPNPPAPPVRRRSARPPPADLPLYSACTETRRHDLHPPPTATSTRRPAPPFRLHDLHPPTCTREGTLCTTSTRRPFVQSSSRRALIPAKLAPLPAPFVSPSPSGGRRNGGGANGAGVELVEVVFASVVAFFTLGTFLSDAVGA